MGSPTIFSGSRTKLLTSKGFLLSDGETIDNDGQINYIRHNSATDIGIWTRYKNATATDTPDGTNTVTGTLGITFTRDTTDPLRGAASFLLTKPASNVQGEGFSYDFTIDNADKGKVLQGSFDYQIASGTFVDDAMTVWIYDITNSRLIQPAPTKLKNSGIIERFPFEFQTSIDSTSYRLIVHQSSAVTTACTIKFDNFKVGPSAKLYGSTSTTPVTATYTLTNFGNATVTGTVSREGVYANFKGKITIGSTLPSGTLTLNLPSGYVMSGIDFKQGVATMYKTPTSAVLYTGQPYSQSNMTSVGFAGGSSAGVWTGNTVPAITQSGDYIEFDFRAQIQGWSSSQIMSSDADTRVVAASYTGITAITLAGSYTNNIIKFPNKVVDTHSGMNISTGEYEVKVSGLYKVSSRISNVYSVINDTASDWYISVIKNGAEVGLNTAPTGAASTSLVAGFNVSDVMIDCKTGDKLSISIYFGNPGASISYTTSATKSNIVNIERLSGPVSIAASESVSALYTGAPVTGSLSGAFNLATYGTKVKDSHNAYSGGTYTVPVSGVYDVSASLNMSGTFALNTQSYVTIGIDSGASDYIGGAVAGGAQNTVFPQVNVKSIPLIAGQTIKIYSYSNGTGVSHGAAAGFSNFSITRSGNY